MSPPSLPYPPRISLGRFPTPVEPLARLRIRPGGGDVWIKRDDLSGTELSGNKVRKLEFLLAEALEQRRDVVVTCGGIQSNHARATAVAARRLGLDSVLYLRGEPPPVPDGNVLLDRLAGAEVVFITPEQYEGRRELMAREAGRLEKEGRRPYVIPEGGSNALGAWGYVAMLEELRGQGFAGKIDRLFFATGSAGTLAGLHLGARLLGLPIRVEGVAVCDSQAYFRERVVEICAEFAGRFGVGAVPEREEIRVIEGYRGPGYAKTTPRLLDLIRRVAREEGLFLDPVYTGKAFQAMIDRLADGSIPPEEGICFLHTGGIFSLFAYRDELFPPSTPPASPRAE